MTKPEWRIADLLLAAYVAIHGALANAEVLAALSLLGYEETQLQAGLALYEEATRRSHAQKAAYGEQHQATEVLHTRWKDAKVHYSRTLKVARLAFKSDVMAQQALMLRGIRRTNLPGWLVQATTFYSNLLRNPGLLAGLGTYGYTEAKLQGELALVQAVAEANHLQEYHKGAARDARHARDDALATLARWLADFKIIAQVAMAEHPTWLVKLGFRARS